MQRVWGARVLAFRGFGVQGAWDLGSKILGCGPRFAGTLMESQPEKIGIWVWSRSVVHCLPQYKPLHPQ